MSISSIVGVQAPMIYIFPYFYNILKWKENEGNADFVGLYHDLSVQVSLISMKYIQIL